MHISTDLRDYYENLHLGHNIVFLYANRLLIHVGAGMLSIFTAVFFYEKFNHSYALVAIIFASAYGIFAIITPLAAQLIAVLGLKKMLIASIFFLPLTILSLVWWDTSPVFSLTIYMFFGSIYRLLYWTPYHIDFAKFTEHDDRGKQISFLSNVSEVVLSFTPFIGGVLIALMGFDAVFITVSVFLTLSIIPLFFIEDTRERYSFGYFETFKRLLQKKNRPTLYAYSGDGIQSITRIIVWPIFIFILLEGKYETIGLITSVTIIALIILRYVVGNVADKWDRNKLLTFGAFFATTGWAFKAFVDTGFQIFVADTYHRLGAAVNRITTDVVMYDHAVDNGHYIDEYTVLREVALNFSRSLFLFASIWIVSTFGISVTFIVAAIATLLMTTLNKEAPVT